MKKNYYVYVSVLLMSLLVWILPMKTIAQEDYPNPELLGAFLELGIVQGDDKGNLALDRTVTRAEWLTMLKRVLDEKQQFIVKPSGTTRSFHELDGHWAENTIRFWVEHGILQGDGNGNLRLDDPITFAEMIITLDRLLGHSENESTQQLELYQNHWAYPALNRFYQLDWIQFDDPLWHDVIEPDRHALRGEVLLLLAPYYFQEIHDQGLFDLHKMNAPFDSPIDVNLDGKVDFSFRVPSNYQLVLQSITEQEYSYIFQKKWTYQIEKNGDTLGNLQFQLQQINEGDVAYFIRYIPITEDQEHFSIELLYYGATNLTGRTPISEIGESKLPYDWKELVLDAEMELPYSGLLLSGDQVELRVSAADTYRELGYSVRDYTKSVQVPTYGSLHSQGYQFTFMLTNKVNYISETWGILGKSNLYDWNNVSFTDFMLRDDISINKRLSMEGLYFRTPSNYVPRSSMSYYLNPANIVGVRAVPLIREGKGRFVEDFSLLLAYMSVQQQTDEGIWPTQPKSEWLEKEYGIGYNYFDNRRNADNATFLLMMYERYPDEVIYVALDKHMQALYDRIQHHSIVTSEQGLLFTDYIGDEESRRTHVALNHHLAVINLLLLWYDQTKDEVAKHYAERMIMGVEDTTDLWIKPNGDLYYALYDDLSPHPYPDYIDLTLQDLRQTQSLIRKHYGNINDAIQKLIETKSLWVNSLK